MTHTAVELLSQLKRAWSIRTATVWTHDNPALGQCSVTALVVQDCLGGSILKTRIGETWHFYNSVRGERLDLTASQFDATITYDDLPATRGEAMADTSPQQYEALRSSLDPQVR